MSLYVLHVHLVHLVTLLLLYLLLPLVAMVTAQTTSECECEVYPPAEADGTGCIRGGFTLDLGTQTAMSDFNVLYVSHIPTRKVQS